MLNSLLTATMFLQLTSHVSALSTCHCNVMRLHANVGPFWVGSPTACRSSTDMRRRMLQMGVSFRYAVTLPHRVIRGHPRMQYTHMTHLVGHDKDNRRLASKAHVIRAFLFLGKMDIPDEASCIKFEGKSRLIPFIRAFHSRWSHTTAKAVMDVHICSR